MEQVDEVHYVVVINNSGIKEVEFSTRQNAENFAKYLQANKYMAQSIVVLKK